ncbi:cbb3-type cytochrome oxidase assembly protein CcoS [Thauera sp.]|uniref:cbb3-type cytochrome oxidase assembly protein CcoS n=1 Tax=Thauera sp. TaxID=1905334 RepID=UPI0039E71195
MEASLYLLIPLSVVLVFVIGALFWWSLRNGQYDDLEGPAYRLLLDDRDETPKEAETPEHGDEKAGKGRAS